MFRCAKFTVALTICGLLLILAADTYARVIVADKSMKEAISEVLHHAPTDALFLFLLLPFALIGCIAAVLGKDGNRVRCWCSLIGGFLPTIFVYFNGYLDSQYALRQRAWTASALSVGLLPFMAAPVAAIGMAIGWMVAWCLRRSCLREAAIPHTVSCVEGGEDES